MDRAKAKRIIRILSLLILLTGMFVMCDRPSVNQPKTKGQPEAPDNSREHNSFNQDTSGANQPNK